MFQLPARRATQRVSVWRRLQKYGALGWKNSAYVLPHHAANVEKFQWLATEIRKHGGEASIVEVARIAGHTDEEVIAMFDRARGHVYERLIRDLHLCLRGAARKRPAELLRDFTRMNRRITEIGAADAFGCVRRKEAESLLRELEARCRADQKVAGSGRSQAREYRGRVWLTRPRPGVDRVGSAWLIKHFIDPEARFAFSADPQAQPGAARFDMFEGEFTHVGDECTFEALVRKFGLRQKRLRQIAQLVHDADIEDNKFGRPEGRAIDLITKGWAQMDWSDEEILRRGFDLFDALYLALGS